MNALNTAKQTCRICGCTDDDRGGCIEKTGAPCFWIEDDLCSACLTEAYPDKAAMPAITHNTIYAVLLLFIFTNGAVIRKLEIDGKTGYAVLADLENCENKFPKFSPAERESRRTFLKTFALKVFPSEKGARGYCRRHRITVNRFERI